jgi:hypothetical protein
MRPFEANGPNVWASGVAMLAIFEENPTKVGKNQPMAEQCK